MVGQIEQLMGYTFDTYTRELVSSEAKVITFQKGTIPIHEGDVLGHLYLIEKGVVRGFYLDEQGTEVTKCFAAEGQVFGSEGLRGAKKSSCHVECLEDCNLFSLPYVVVEEIAAREEWLRTYISECFLEEVTRLERRTKNLLLLDATKRYEMFLKEFPSLEERVKLQHIASYIGIRPASLSRIRKEKKLT